jgi:signal peptidase I
MAEVKNNIVTQGVSGMLGDQIVFRQIKGKTIISLKPKQPEKYSEKQLEVRRRFQSAVIYGKSATADPAKKAEYEAGKGDKFNSAYHVAVADFLNAPDIQEVNLKGYKGNVGDVITIRVTDDFKVAEVTVTIRNPDGTLVEEGKAAPLPGGVDWSYKATAKNDSLVGDRITITAYDMPGNETVKNSPL